VLREVGTDRLAVTLENHTVVGGLFETVASEAARRGLGRQITPIALPDEFLAAGRCPPCTIGTGCRLACRRIGARAAVASLLTHKC